MKKSLNHSENIAEHPMSDGLFWWTEERKSVSKAKSVSRMRLFLLPKNIAT